MNSAATSSGGAWTREFGNYTQGKKRGCLGFTKPDQGFFSGGVPASKCLGLEGGVTGTGDAKCAETVSAWLPNISCLISVAGSGSVLGSGTVLPWTALL